MDLYDQFVGVYGPETAKALVQGVGLTGPDELTEDYPHYSLEQQCVYALMEYITKPHSRASLPLTVDEAKMFLWRRRGEVLKIEIVPPVWPIPNFYWLKQNEPPV